MASQTLSLDVVGNTSSGSRALRDLADSAGTASRAARELSDRLSLQSKTAQVAAGASLALAKSDDILRDAELELSGAAAEARRKLAEQGRAAEEAAAKTEASGGAASLAAGAFGALGQYAMPAAIAAGVALSPVIATVGLGLGGLGVAALGASKDTAAMRRELAPLRSELGLFQQSLKPEVLGLFGQGAGIASHLLRDLQPVAAATGKALSGVLSQLDAEFASQQWQDFFRWMAQNAAPDVQLLGNLFVDLTRDLPPLLEELQPAAAALLITADAGAKLTGWLEVGVAALHGNTQAAAEAAAGQATLGKSALDAAASFAAAGAGAKKAGPQVGTLAGDMAILAANTSSSTLALQAFDDEWGIFVGRSVSDQQAVLSASQAFENYAGAVKQSGRTSAAAQAAFLNIFDTLKSGLDALLKNGAGVAAVNGYYQTAISRLDALHGLSATQKADVRGLTADYLAWANSVSGLSGNTVAAANVLRQDFLAQLAIGHKLAPSARADVDALATSILKTGQNSSATLTDRARLIRDLEKSGLSAFQATADVNGLQRQIDHLRGKTVNVGLTTSGHGQIIITGTGINQRVINTSTGVLRGPGGHTLAAGGMISGGTAGRDSVPAMLMPGEVVVPASMVSAGAVDHLRGRLPGFAAGGAVGRAAAAQAAIAGSEALFGQAAAAAFAQAAVRAAAAALSGPAGGPLSASAAAAQAFARSLLPSWGWGASQWPPLQALWQRESGWNSYAVNPGSGAYGIPQSLGHGHPYNLGDYQAQVRWGLAYIFDRYGSPAAAWGHELAYGWYDKGGMLRPGYTLAYNGTGRPEQVMPPGGGAGGGDVHVHVSVNAPVGSEAELERWFVNVMDSAARSGRLRYALRQSPSAA